MFEILNIPSLFSSKRASIIYFLIIKCPPATLLSPITPGQRAEGDQTLILTLISRPSTEVTFDKLSAQRVTYTSDFRTQKCIPGL